MFFWKIFEALIRLIFFRRFRKAKQIGQAAELLAAGKPEEALVHLERTGQRLHRTLLPLWAYTRGRILDRLQRVDEAIQSFNVALTADPGHTRAQLELAVLFGRRFNFEDSRALLEDLAGKVGDDDRPRVQEIANLLEQVTSGHREADFERRARLLAERDIPPDGRAPGLPPDLSVLDAWIEAEPAEARRDADEIALLLAQGEVAGGATWRVSLGLDESVVVRPDGSALNPFAVTEKRFASGSPPLARLLAQGWEAPPGDGDQPAST